MFPLLDCYGPATGSDWELVLNDKQWAWLSDVLGVERMLVGTRSDGSVGGGPQPGMTPPTTGLGRPMPGGPGAGSLPEDKKKAEDAEKAIVARYRVIKQTFEMAACGKAFFASYVPFNAAFKAADYTKALTFVAAMEKSLAEMESVAKELPKKQKAADAEASKVNAMKDGDVKKMSAAGKAAAVRALLAAGAPTGDARKAQIKIYKNAELDPVFLKEDEKRGDEIAKELKGDKELKAARKDWKTSSEADKIKMLKKVVAAQSKRFGIDPPEIVIEHNAPVTVGTSTFITNGYFSPDDGKLHINMDPASSVQTFQTAVDLALHENAHNWQAHLVKDLVSGTLKESDPNYQQALMFAVNALNPGGYVKGEEDMAAYQKQPMEEHSWLTGPETAKKILKGL